MRPYALFLGACLVAALAPLAGEPAPRTLSDEDFPGWPARFEGRELVPCPLSQKEKAFQTGFPGRIGRFTDGEREILLRFVAEPTRKLHAAASCMVAAGYEVEPLPLVVDSQGQTWNAFRAARGETRLVMRERIFDEEGGSWPDVSSWYWPALFGRSKGPWWAVTVVEVDEAE